MQPQTRALIIGKYGCLAMTYLWCIGIEPDEPAELIRYVSESIDDGILDQECTVLDAEKFLRSFTGRRWKVTKENITDISQIKERTPVRYEYNGSGHWVGVENGKIMFNSLDFSNCVEKGKPVQARIIKLA